MLQRGQKRGTYQVPYRTLLPGKVNNLLAVGKSSSGGRRFRTHMLSLIMGQAAGIAAGLSVKDGVRPRDVSVQKLQSRLREAGIRLE